jgi:N-acetylglucosamine-6-phosphate deacetylase
MIIQSLRVWINQQFIPAQIHLHHHQIIKISTYNEFEVDIDYGHHKIVPGFIDIHIHGAYGYDTNDADPEGIKAIMKGLVSEGVTSFCPTTVTQHPDILNKALKNVAMVAKDKVKGASIVGVHLEGPFLNHAYKGAQPSEFIIPASIDLFNEFYSSSGQLIKIITMATELDYDFQLTKHCKDLGVSVSIGHSAATYEEASLAVANGASSMTHVFNGMSGFHHRSYNLAGAAHRLHGVYAEIIGDGNHVTWPAIYTLMLAKGPYHSILITDSLSVKGSPQGEYELGGQKIEVRSDGSAYLKGTQTLSGSTLKMNEGLRNLVEYAQVPIQYAINATSMNPAALLGLSHKKGKIAYQYDADLVVLDDQYQTVATYVLGECVYTNEGNK